MTRRASGVLMGDCLSPMLTRRQTGIPFLFGPNEQHAVITQTQITLGAELNAWTYKRPYQ
jgi:hypothetical protein